MSSKRELREAIRIAEREEMAQEVVAATRERDRWSAEVVKLRARVAELEAAILEHATTEPETEPRPFRVGDRVRVAEGATKKGLVDGQPMKSLVQGMSGEVVRIHTDGDLYVYTDGPCGYVSPEFCTLIEPELEPDDDTPTPQPVTLTLPDGTSVTFDAVVTR